MIMRLSLNIEIAMKHSANPWRKLLERCQYETTISE